MNEGYKNVEQFDQVVTFWKILYRSEHYFGVLANILSHSKERQVHDTFLELSARSGLPCLMLIAMWCINISIG